LLSFGKFQVKPINFDDISRRSAVILDFLISQGNVAKQLRCCGKPCNSYKESFCGNLSENKCENRSTFAEVM